MKFFKRIIIFIFLYGLLFAPKIYATNTEIKFISDKQSVAAGEKLKLTVEIPKSTTEKDSVRVCSFSIDYDEKSFSEPTVTNQISDFSVVNTSRIFDNKTQVYYTFANTIPINLDSDSIVLVLEFQAKQTLVEHSSDFVFNMINLKYGSDVSDNIEYINPSLININLITQEYLKGDVNNDGEIKIADAMIVFQSLSGRIPPLEANQMVAADLDNNGQITIADAMRLFRIIATS